MYNFYLNLSQNFANRFADIYQDLEFHDNKIAISGLRGVSNTNIKDFEIDISRDRFIELANFESVGKDLILTTICTDLKKPSHRRILESIITDCIRRKNIFCDCSWISLKMGNSLKFCLRQSAELVTQRPTSFSALFQDSFDLLHEVKQGEYAITTSSDNKPVLATWHLAECVAFVAYNHFLKIGILAHIDTCADIEDFFEKLKQSISLLTSESLEIDYMLIGGREELPQFNHREKIKKMASKASSVLATFRCIKEFDDLIPKEALEIDSYWVVSMRLSRSVALDLRENDPLINIKSYEPDLNDNSSFHKRSGSFFEANAFESKREREKVLTLSYNGLV